MKFRRRIGAQVLGGQGGILQGSHGDEAQVTNPVFLILGDIDIGGPQVRIQVTSVPADGQGGTQIQTQIDSAEMGHGIATHILIQGLAVAAQQVNLVTQMILLLGYDLPVLVGYEALKLGELLEQLGFPDDSVGELLEIVHGSGGVFICTGQQQGIQLDLGCGNGNDFYYVFFVGILLHGRTAADTAVVAHGAAHDKTVQQRRDEFGFGQIDRLL